MFSSWKKKKRMISTCYIHVLRIYCRTTSNETCLFCYHLIFSVCFLSCCICVENIINKCQEGVTLPKLHIKNLMQFKAVGRIHCTYCIHLKYAKRSHANYGTSHYDNGIMVRPFSKKNNQHSCIKINGKQNRQFFVLTNQIDFHDRGDIFNIMYVHYVFSCQCISVPLAPHLSY